MKESISSAILFLMSWAYITEIFQRHSLLNLFRQCGRLDSQRQQALRVGRLGTEICNVEFVQSHRVDSQTVLPRGHYRAQHVPDRVFNDVAVSPQNLLRDAEVPLLAQPRLRRAGSVARLQHQVTHAVNFDLKTRQIFGGNLKNVPPGVRPPESVFRPKLDVIARR